MKLEKKYGLFTAIAMVIGIVIGSGVFFKAQDILNKTQGNVTIGIVAWLIGGAIMLVCALTFAFMATKYEKVNGVVDYAEATVGEKYAYIIGWFMSTIYYPTLTSVLAWVSARYTVVFVNAINPEFAGGNPINSPECIAIALFYLIASYAVNSLSPKLAGRFQVSTTIIKLIPLGLMAIGGIIVGLLNQQLLDNFAVVSVVEGATEAPIGSLFGAVVATAFAYEGWIIATSINAEIKDSKKNLPLALVFGSIVVVAVYVLYFVGVAGGASVEDLIANGATLAFKQTFGSFLGVILDLFVVISCLGTLNGLMLGCTRGMYCLASRGRGPLPKVFSKVDEETNMPTNASILGLLLCGFWFLYFYAANLTSSWFGFFTFDSSEIPIITIYALYIPIFISYIIKSKDVSNPLKRFVLPILAVLGSLFMVYAACYAHKLAVVAYLIVFAIVICIGLLFMKKKNI